MVASAGVVEDSSRNPVRIVTPRMPMLTPMIAVSSGRPAATSEPNVMTRTTRATRIPMPSAAPAAVACSANASPPTATVRPASSSVATASCIASSSAAVSSTAGRS